jgi:nicotinate-nucleotide adenylyltransferase
MRRPGEHPDLENLEQELPGISSKIHYVDAPLLEIASREIRSRIANRQPFRYYIPLPVCNYIEQHHLYEQSEAQNLNSKF